MRFAIDLDGTAWKYRQLFAALMRALQQGGHLVGILTAHDPELEKEDRRLLLARGFPVPDFFINKLEPAEPCKPWKERMVEEHGIDCLFDDFDSPTIVLYCPHPDQSKE